jgi:hypothetical protein
VQSEGLNGGRSRLPTSPADLMLRMLNVMVDSYLELRKELSAELDRWQQELLRPRADDRRLGRADDRAQRAAHAGRPVRGTERRHAGMAGHRSASSRRRG